MEASSSDGSMPARFSARRRSPPVAPPPARNFRSSLSERAGCWTGRPDYRVTPDRREFGKRVRAHSRAFPVARPRPKKSVRTKGTKPRTLTHAASVRRRNAANGGLKLPQGVFNGVQCRWFGARERKIQPRQRLSLIQKLQKMFSAGEKKSFQPPPLEPKALLDFTSSNFGGGMINKKNCLRPIRALFHRGFFFFLFLF